MSSYDRHFEEYSRSFMFSAFLMDAYRVEYPGTRITYWMDGQHINQLRKHSHSRVPQTTIHELLLACDCVLNAKTVEDIQRNMDLFGATFNNF
ncbi:unnamed protein product [Schistocephalus solidus]|uniref:NP1 n=1 Tax=Schistocephalus solidus TaxID=70667 RepID=A0A183SK45_SCHSO|nr:unnamed protein product [Schistocephalus solidus]